ncbi:TGF_BETA_2 domain-containing protein [Meloidogyne graminicola]|uniref:TGF_BETA_2 domain-containing protein n=1 Tax=Meloidogyne graminicola TaxID=189291 RepID=A0A8S9ZWX4_9BILA|nr:TGF_BETA_2 domain-containing protein [Meloidogyne graminicola]
MYVLFNIYIYLFTNNYFLFNIENILYIFKYNQFLEYDCSNCGNFSNVNENEFVLEFQINGLSSNEILINAQLLLLLPSIKEYKYRHYYYKINKKQKLFKLNNIELFAYFGNKCVNNKKLIKEKIQTLEEENNLILNNWFIYNVKKFIEKNENKGNNKLYLIIKIVQKGKLLNKDELVNFVYSHGPFLVIYTKEENKLIKNKRNKREIFQEEEENNNKIKEHMNSVKKQSEYFAYGMALPNEEQYLLNENNQNKLEKINKNNSNKLDNTKFALKRKKLKNKKKLNKNQEKQFLMQMIQCLDLEQINHLGNKCSRLDDRIIAPKSFDAGYCSGLCEYPINKNLKPSNHAIFQSLIVRLESLTNINNTPQVCCAPDKLDSLTMLYFNDNGNLNDNFTMWILN